MPLSRRIPESSIGLYSTTRFVNFPCALLLMVGAEVGHKSWQCLAWYSEAAAQ